ncbi:unnamed protein product, partial [Allacma fusca]
FGKLLAYSTIREIGRVLKHCWEQVCTSSTAIRTVLKVLYRKIKRSSDLAPGIIFKRGLRKLYDINVGRIGKQKP